MIGKRPANPITATEIASSKGDIVDCLHRTGSIGRASRIPQITQGSFTIHYVPFALPEGVIMTQASSSGTTYGLTTGRCPVLDCCAPTGRNSSAQGGALSVDLRRRR